MVICYQICDFMEILIHCEGLPEAIKHIWQDVLVSPQHDTPAFFQQALGKAMLCLYSYFYKGIFRGKKNSMGEPL